MGRWDRPKPKPDVSRVLRDHVLVDPIYGGCKCGQPSKGVSVRERFDSWYEHIGALLVEAQAREIKAAFESARERAAGQVRKLASEILEPR